MVDAATSQRRLRTHRGATAPEERVHAHVTVWYASGRDQETIRRNTQMRLLLFNLATDASDPVLGFTTRWISGLADRCEYVDVVTMRCGEAPLPENARVFSVGGERSLSEAARALNFYRILHELLSTRTYDSCFAHMMPLFATMAWPYLRAKRIPLNLWYAHKSTPPLLRMTEKLADRIISSSPEGFRVPTRKLVITGQGIETELFTPREKTVQGQFTVISLSRIAPVKNIEVLIDAAAKMCEKRGDDDLRIRIVGPTREEDRAYEGMLRRRVEKHGLERAVEFRGPVRWAETVMEFQQADMMVNLGDTGSLDKAALEAMSCALPVVTSNPAFASLLRPVDPRLMLSQPNAIELATSCDVLRRMTRDKRREIGGRLRQVVVRGHSFDRLMEKLTTGALAVKPRS